MQAPRVAVGLHRWGAAALLSLSLAVPMSAEAQEHRFDGVWRMLRSVSAVPDSTWSRPPFEGVVVLSGEWFSQLVIVPAPTGVHLASVVMTPEEKVARFDQLLATVGTMVVRDTMVEYTIRHARSPQSVGTKFARRWRLIGDTMSLTSRFPWPRDTTRMLTVTDWILRER